jgi:hypothetical protein
MKNAYIELIESWIEVAEAEGRSDIKLKIITDSMKRWVKANKEG